MKDSDIAELRQQSEEELSVPGICCQSTAGECASVRLSLIDEIARRDGLIGDAADSLLQLADGIGYAASAGSPLSELAKKIRTIAATMRQEPHVPLAQSVGRRA